MSRRTILLADEDVDTRIILRALLERHDYTVVEAANAQQAALACEEPVAVVILNYPMYYSEQTSLAAWLRTQPQTREVPIINLTSRPVGAFIEEASRDGVTITLPKPIDVQRMVQVIDELAATVPAS